MHVRMKHYADGYGPLDVTNGWVAFFYDLRRFQLPPCSDSAPLNP